jgi:hypothetical protein
VNLLLLLLLLYVTRAGITVIELQRYANDEGLTVPLGMLQLTSISAAAFVFDVQALQ